MRRYREDSERVVHIRNYWVRRPQAAPVKTNVNLQDILEVLSAFIVLGLICFAFWLWLAIAAASQS